MSYIINRRWSDVFIPKVKRIIGYYLLEESTFEVDVSEAADLVMIKTISKGIAVRLRKYGYYKSFSDEFTIRYKTKSGGETEHSKIIRGFGDWFFYGHIDKENLKIEHWMLIDLDIWREGLKKIPGIGLKKSNNDGTYFMVYNINSFPDNLLIASSKPV